MLATEAFGCSLFVRSQPLVVLARQWVRGVLKRYVILSWRLGLMLAVITRWSSEGLFTSRRIYPLWRRGVGASGADSSSEAAQRCRC
ncbi:hypothetical protein Bca52824_068569 [Brassica carinata]|uniref:Uncharacterized protein n=1 Tax=Brassica carinata TaxID=52824 RepID=A0A8X7Q2T6_BRACI|nr:hypothetical protein Bca52824_068569 [Brassica carinata]